jgi:single-stranded-DNA-specific exonuclease
MAVRRVLQIAEEVTPPPALLEALQGDQLLASMLARRGITTPQAARAFLFPDHYPVTAPEELPDLAIARDRIVVALENGENIAVWGDFDVDGQTSTSLLVGALRALGADPAFHIPIRKEEGHGIDLRALETFLDTHPVDLLITCDTGIAEHEAIEFSNARGIEVIITDHHNLPDILPPALACVNPQRVALDHPLRTLTGAGCAYKLIEAVCRERQQPEIAHAQLDLAALGTVADVGPLRDENRYIVQRGLEVIRSGKRLGLATLLAVSRTAPATFNTEGISFAIAPRMNSLGRLADANPMVELLTTDSPARAEQMAFFIEGLNQQRKGIQERIRKEAFAMLENNPHWLDYDVILLYQRDWDPGVVGIVANSIVERYGKPAILLSGQRADGTCHGSARSLEGVPIIDIINANRPLIEGLGHTMAAGAWLKIEDIQAAREALHRTAQAMLPDGLPPFVQPIERELSLSEIDLDFIERFEQLEPFGTANPKPVFYTREVRLHNSLIFGRDENHRKVTVEDADGNLLTLTWWSGAAEALPEGVFDIAYTLQSTAYGGAKSVEATWVDARPVLTAETIEVERRPLVIVDLRQPTLDVAGIDTEVPYCFYREGSASREIEGVDRLGVVHAPQLVLYSAPPSLTVLRSLMESCQPNTLILHLQSDPKEDQREYFLQQLAGMVKHALRNLDGWLPLARLSAALNQRDVCVLKGLQLLEAAGQIRIINDNEQGIQVGTGSRQPQPEKVRQAQQELDFLLKESAAFRTQLRTAPLAWFQETLTA